MNVNKARRSGKASAALVVTVFLCVALAGGFYFLVLQKPKAAPQKEAELEEPKADLPEPERKPEPEVKEEPKPEVKPDPKPKVEPEPDPEPVVEEKSEVDLYLEKKFPFATFRPLEELVQNWQKVPQRAFPDVVTVHRAAVYSNKSKSLTQEFEANHQAKPVKFNKGTLILSPAENPQLTSLVKMEDTDFKERVSALYDEKVEEKRQQVIAEREAHRAEAIAFLAEAADPADEVKYGSRSTGAQYSNGDYWADLSATIAGEKIFGTPASESKEEFRDEHAMYHKGDIVFTPLGQLDAYAISSRQYAGLLLYTIEKDSPLAKAGIQPWDLIYKVNKSTLPRNPEEKNEGIPGVRLFAEKLIEAEETGRTLTLYVKRNAFIKQEEEENLKFDIKLAAKGSLSPFLEQGKFTDRAAEHSLAAVNFLLDTQKEDGSWKCGYNSQLSTSLAGTHLIMAAEKFPEKQRDILKSIKKAANYLKERQKWDWGWDYGSATWFLSEYFWATGDEAIYPTLVEYVGQLKISINPFGGITHQRDQAPYGNINLGGPSGLARMGLKTAQMCRAGNYAAFSETELDKYVFELMDNDNTPQANLSGYMGHLVQVTNIGPDAMNTGAFLAGIQRNDYGDDPYAATKKRIAAGMYTLLQEGHLQVNHIHATPALGGIFTAISLSACDEDESSALKNGLIQKRTWQLALMRDSKDLFQYSYPRFARMALPGGGGWNGDSLMGMQHLAAVSTISMLNAPSKNLLVNAGEKPRPMAWLDPKVKTDAVWKSVLSFHQKQFSELVEDIKNSSKKTEQLPEALVAIDRLLNNYPHASFATLYDRDAMGVIHSVLRDATRNKVEMPDYQIDEAEAFLKKAYATQTSTIEWMKLLSEVHKKKSLKGLTQRVKELGS